MMTEHVEPPRGDSRNVGTPHQHQKQYPLLGRKAVGAPLKSTAVLYAFAAGVIGAHSFYLGKRRLGQVRLISSLTGFVLFCVGFGVAIMSASAGPLLIAFIIIGFLLILGNAIWGYVDCVIILATPESKFGR